MAYYVLYLPFRYLLMLTAIIFIILCIGKLVIRWFTKDKMFTRSTAVMLCVGFLVPYLFFYHGLYRYNRLNISEKNIESIVSALEKFEYKIPEYVGPEDYDPGYIGEYEAQVNDVDIRIFASKADMPQKLSDFVDESTALGYYDPIDGCYGNIHSNIHTLRYGKKIRSGSYGESMWVVSPLVAITLEDPLVDCGYVYLGAYEGCFEIQHNNVHYFCEYSYETRDVVFRWTMCTRPRSITALELLSMFENVENQVDAPAKA